MKKFLSLLCSLSVAVGLFITPTTAYAADFVTVSFDTGCDCDVNPVQVAVGNTYEPGPIECTCKPVQPTFMGWFVDSELNVAYNADQPVTAPFTLYAKWSDGVAIPPSREYFYALDDVNYQKIFTSGAASSYLECQPINALTMSANVKGVTPVTEDCLDSTGVINLPRLKAGYYYKLEEEDISNYDLSLSRTAYPTLSWYKDIPEDTELELTIMYETEEIPFYKTTLHFNDALDKANNLDTGHSFIIERALKHTDSMKTFTTDIYGYNPDLHKECIIMPNYVTFTDPAVSYFDDALLELSGGLIPANGVTNVKDFPNYYYDKPLEGGNYTSTLTADIDKYAYFAGMADVDSSVMCFGTKTKGVSIDNNTHEITTIHNTNDTHESFDTDFLGAYLIATNEELELHRIRNEELESDTVLTTVPNNPSKVATVGPETYIDAMDAFGPIAAKCMGEILLSGAISGTIEINEESDTGYAFKYIGTEDKDVNVYGASLGYFGYIPSVGVLKCEAADNMVQVNCWAKDLKTGADVMVKSVLLNLNDSPVFNYVHDYGDSLYRASEWYTDKEFTAKADVNTWLKSAKHGDVLDIYCYADYIGGTYKVVFYNDSTESSSEATFETRYQPTLPEVAARSGYLFKNWCIVDTIASTDGTPYDGTTFKPVKDKTYTFKTFWDIQGIIKEVKTTKTEYYTGDSIDKSKVIVTVQTDNTGTVKTLNTNEFSISPAKVEKDGTNQILVTYNATGATGTFIITGNPVEVTKISAKYEGKPITVGKSISKDDLAVTVHYNNGSKDEITNFTFTPKTIKNAGVNSIKITYGDLSTTVSIKGVAVEENKEDLVKKLSYISATYSGITPYVGDALSKDDFRVYAHYSDGSRTLLSSSNYTISPIVLSTEGANTITISYSGKTCSMTIQAKSKSTTAGGTTSNTGSGTSTGSGTGTGSNTGTSTSGSNGNSNSSNNSGSNESGETKGDPSTGAGVPSSEKGTSSAYLHGSNVLNSYTGSNTSADIKNDIDILKEIKSAGNSASSVDVTLYNGAANNYITSEMLSLLKNKGLRLNVTMIDAETKSNILAKWSVIGQTLDDTDFTLDPNIAFETKDKGDEQLMFITVNDVKYPKGFLLDVYPPLNYYESGETVRTYTVNSNGSNSMLCGTFKWGDSESVLTLDVYESTYYALSNAARVYENGSNLLDSKKVDLTEDVTEAESEVTLDEVETEPEFDWGDTPVEPSPERTSNKKSPVLLILVVVCVLVIVAAGVGAIFVIKSKGVKNSFDDFDDDDTDSDEIGYDDEDDDSGISYEDSSDDFNNVPISNDAI